MKFSDLIRLNISIYTSLDQQQTEIEINLQHNSNTIFMFLRNWRHYEGLEEYNNEEIKIFDSFGDIKAKYKNKWYTDYIKMDNTGIEQKNYLNKIRNIGFQKKILLLSFQKLFIKKFMIFFL